MNRYFACFGLPGSLVLTVCMSLYALILALISQTPARWLFFAAMFFSSMGDLLLMGLRDVNRIFPNSFTLGAFAFMLAHLLYTAGFAIRIRGSGQSYMNPGMFIGAAAAAACILYLIVHCKDSSQILLAAAYSVVITIHCLTACSYTWGSAKTYPLAALSAIGAICFLLSDAIIGLGILARVHRFDHLIWWLYPIGQLLLLTGAGI